MSLHVSQEIIFFHFRSFIHDEQLSPLTVLSTVSVKILLWSCEQNSITDAQLLNYCLSMAGIVFTFPHSHFNFKHNVFIYY